MDTRNTNSQTIEGLANAIVDTMEKVVQEGTANNTDVIAASIVAAATMAAKNFKFEDRRKELLYVEQLTTLLLNSYKSLSGSKSRFVVKGMVAMEGGKKN